MVKKQTNYPIENTTIDIRHLPIGLYHIQVLFDDRIWTGQFAKHH